MKNLAQIIRLKFKYVILVIVWTMAISILEKGLDINFILKYI